MSFVVFPLLPVVNGVCGCFRGSACSRPGKHPAVPWRDLEEGSPVPRPAPGAGYGIKTGARPKGSGIVVVDLDSPEAVDAWLELGGSEDTYTVQTGRGLQLYFQHPGFYVSNSTSQLAPHIDLRGDGGFVVGPGSPHASGATYTAVDERAPVPVPTWLLDWLRQQPARTEVQPHPEDVAGTERERRREIYGNWLAAEAPPCVAGQNGDETLFKVVQRGAYDLALPTEDVLELVAEHYDPRCDPPWGDELEERVLHKARDAKEKSTRPRSVPLLVEEEVGLAEVFEHTQLVNPKLQENGPPETFGFKLKRGGWDRTPIPPNYLVNHLLVENKVSMIFAEPGTIKSWTAIDIAACVSEGLPWLGERTTAKGPALYVDFEDGEAEFHRRVHILTGRQERADLIYTYAPGTISKPEWWKSLEKLTISQGIKFVVIDTMAGATVGVNENETLAAAPLIYAGWFTEATQATVLVLHHANRAGDIRGTSAFKANVDTLFKLETLEDENGVHKAKLSCIKSGHKKVYPIHLELTDDGLSQYEPPAKSDVEKGDKEDKRTLDELQAEVLLLIDSEGPFSSIEKIRTQVKARTANVNAVIAELHQSGEIYKSPEGWRRDGEEFRRKRLRDTIRRNPGWGAKALVAAACVEREFFDRCVREKLIAEAVVGSKEDGFVWRESNA